jgi:dynein heavy chain, axonemal
VGEIPNLFSPKEDLPGIREKIKKEYLNEKKLPKDARIHDDELNEYFYTRI